MGYEKRNGPEIMERVEMLLDEKGISKMEFYAKTGINSGSASQWKTGMYSPSIRSVQKMAEFLGVTALYLITGDESAKYPGQKARENSKTTNIAKTTNVAKSSDIVKTSTSNVAQNMNAQNLFENTIRFAMFGENSQYITDEDVKTVMDFAAFIAEKRKKEVEGDVE